MNYDELSENKRIELSTAEGFLQFFNVQHDSSYEVVHVAGEGETPDIVAKDTHGNVLDIEITMTEDRSGDIMAALGRSNHRSIEALRADLEAVQDGKKPVQFSSLQDNVVELLKKRIGKKLIPCYGVNVALVIRETTGVPWDWQMVLPQLRDYLDGQQVTFDRGIWLLSRAKDRLTHVYGNVE